MRFKCCDARRDNVIDRITVPLDTALPGAKA
jgi:hypothetical protein